MRTTIYSIVLLVCLFATVLLFFNTDSIQYGDICELLTCIFVFIDLYLFLKVEAVAKNESE